MAKLEFFILLFLTGCAGSSYSLRPDPGPAEFLNGREFHWREVQGTKVSVALEDYRTSQTTFRVKIENSTGRALEVAPSTMSCLSGTGDFGVVDPEQRLADLRGREAALEPSGLDTAGRVLNDTSLLLNSFSNREEDKRLRAEADAREAEYKAKDRDSADERAQIRRDKRYWADQVLRRTTVPQRGNVTGDVVCRTPEDYRDLVLRVKMPGASADFHFERYETR